MWPIRLRETRAQEGSVGRRPAGMGKVSSRWGTGCQVIGYSPSGIGGKGCELAAGIPPALSTRLAYGLWPMAYGLPQFRQLPAPEIPSREARMRQNQVGLGQGDL